MPRFVWIPSRNIAFASKDAKGGFVQSGEPDGRVHAPRGLVFYVECKAFFGGITLTDFRDNQENWYRHNCVESGTNTLHYIGMAAYPERLRPARMNLDHWRLFLIPTPLWLSVRDLAASDPFLTQTIPLTAELGTRKWKEDLNAVKYFLPFELESVRVSETRTVNGKTVERRGIAYRIPGVHPIWTDLCTSPLHRSMTFITRMVDIWY